MAAPATIRWPIIPWIRHDPLLRTLRGVVRTRRTALPRTVWMLGLVSLLMDTSSEAIHSVLPLFLAGVLGASPLVIGLIEGIGEATGAITKLFSGRLSDRIGRRKGLLIGGYGLAALTKPIFALAPSVSWVLGARFVDRVGKGIRGAPRDALVADVTPAGRLGAAYGLRQSLDTIGAVAGPVLALALLALWHDAYRVVFWVAAIPAAATIVVLALGVREPRRHGAGPAPRPPPLTRDGLARLGRPFWLATVTAVLMTMARFSEAFLVLRAADSGLHAGLAPVIIVAMNMVYALAGYPVGLLSDRVGRRGLLGWGLAALIAADLALGLGHGVVAVLAGGALWGLHMGMTQGVLSALVADAAPVEARGTAFGLFHLLTGLSMLAASLAAGALWSLSGPAAAFLTGAGFAALALLLSRAPLRA